jgi:outer membrane immunogenic protein
MHRFRSQLLATAAFLAFTGAAYAADMGMPVKAPPASAPPPPLTWTGFYIGANLGAGFGDKWWTGDNGACGTTANAVFYGCSGANIGTTSMDGFLGGFQAGYNWQTGQWVFGIEGTWDWTDMHGKFPLSSVLASNGTFGATASSKIEWIATVVGRVGVTIDRALLYAGGGAAWVHEKDDVTWNLAGISEIFDVSGSNTPFGFTFLTGVEYRIDPNWSARIQYNFYDFRSKDVTLNYANAASQSAFGPADVTTELRIHSITAGVNYKFWGY